MTFLNILNQHLDELHLLKHPLYKAWNDGTLRLETLRVYGREYYHHVTAFPRYISTIHSLCPHIKSRQILLENLIEEEHGEENHPELWLRFAEGLGVSRELCHKEAELSKTHALVEGYFDLVRSDYATGLGALYAYERQTPEISKSKIEGLNKNYKIKDQRTLQFFEVHMTYDVHHRNEIAKLLENLTLKNRKKASQGAREGAQLLWSFLDGIMEIHHVH